jgi:Cu/Ag efflux protein CusF
MEMTVMAGALAGLALLAGCRLDQSAAAAPTAGAAADAKTYAATGVVVGFQSGGKIIVIHHGAIAGLMDEMTMPYELRDPGLAAAFKAGDKVQFTLSVKDDAYTVTALTKR